MKKLLHSLILLAACVVTAFAAPASDPKHEEFAQNYLPESLAVFTQLSTELAETEALQKSLKEDLVLFDILPDGNRFNLGLLHKIFVIQDKLESWKKFLQENYLSHLGNMKTSEQLAAEDSALAKKTIAWKNSELKNALKTGAAQAFSGIMIQIPGKDYSIGKYEVTQAQYAAVMRENPSSFKGEDLPVGNVSWDDAMAFCEKLTRTERAAGRLPAGKKYTLPTSAQWEYACRAGTTTEYYTGDGEEALDRAGWYSGNSGRKTHPVGQKEPNAWGIYDMHGNVWEWCRVGRGDWHVYRGGSYNNYDRFCRSSNEFEDVRFHRNNNVGFRVALVPDDAS